MFTSRDAAKVSAVLCIHAHPPLRLGEIATSSGLDYAHTQRALGSLIRSGLVTQRTIRDARVYEITTQTPYLPAMRLAALVDIGLVAALEPVRRKIRFALVIGSFARRSQMESSDLDLLVVGDITRPEVERLGAPLIEGLDRSIDVIALSDNEIREQLASHAGGLLRIDLLEGIRIMGDPDLIESIRIKGGDDLVSGLSI